jgi:hypothetical protein
MTVGVVTVVKFWPPSMEYEYEIGREPPVLEGDITSSIPVVYGYAS